MILRNTVLTLYSSANTARIEIFTLIQRENQPSLQRHKQLLAISFATNFPEHVRDLIYRPSHLPSFLL